MTLHSQISTAPKVSHSYYVVMEDFGKRGLEARVQPEVTRRGVIERIASGEYREVAFIHHVDGLYVEDVTAEIMAEANSDRADDGNSYRYHATGSPAGGDAQAAAFDHAQDHRKHAAAE